MHRDITTPVWDKLQPCKTDKDGTVSYLPKRNQNGVIICRSAVDQESCIFADNVRALRQHEYDNASLYSETDAAQAELNEKGKQNFIQFVKDLSKKKHARSSESIIVNWNRVYDYLCLFAKSDYIPFSLLSQKLMEDFKMYLLTAPRGDKRKGLLSQNTANTYFAIFKCAVHQAFIDGYITVDIAAKVKGVPEEEVRREHLSLEELNQLAQTPCDNPILYVQPYFLHLQDCASATSQNSNGLNWPRKVSIIVLTLTRRRRVVWSICLSALRHINYVVSRENLSNLFLKVSLTNR